MGPRVPRQAGRPVTQPRQQRCARLARLGGRVGWLPAGMLCAAAASPPSSITFASCLPWQLPRGEPCRDALAEPCGCRMPPCPLPGGKGTGSHGGPWRRRGGWGPWSRTGGWGPRQTPGTLASHPARRRQRHHPTGGWGSCKLLIINLLPGLSVCLSAFPTICLAR